MHLLLQHRSDQLCSDLGRGADWESPLDDLGAGERRAAGLDGSMTAVAAGG